VIASRAPILVVTGLAREAAFAAGTGVVTIAGGGSRPALERALAAYASEPFGAVISFGLAGGLDPILLPGDLVVPDEVVSGDGRWACSPAIVRQWSRSLGASGDETRLPVTLAGLDAPVADSRAKAALRSATGAAAADMESHLAAAFAAERTLPFGVLRVICDPAARDLPPAALVAMRPDGGIALGAVLGSLLRRPAQVPALIRTGRDAGAAFRTLGRVRGLLGDRFGLDL
jgi:adenosylhomocysteine nucleosidase